MTSITPDTICRICHGGSDDSDIAQEFDHLVWGEATRMEEEEEEDLGPLIAPCKCSGSIRFVHTSCLNRFRHHSANNSAAHSATTALSILRIFGPLHRFRFQDDHQLTGNMFRCSLCGSPYLFRGPSNCQHGALETFETVRHRFHHHRGLRWSIRIATIVLTVMMIACAVAMLGFACKLVLWHLQMHTFFVFQGAHPASAHDLDRFMARHSVAAADGSGRREPIDYATIAVHDELSPLHGGKQQWQLFDLQYTSAHSDVLDKRDQRWVSFWTLHFWSLDSFHVFLGLVGLNIAEVGALILFSRFVIVYSTFLITTGSHDRVWSILLSLMLSDTVPGLSAVISRFDVYLSLIFLCLTTARFAITCWSLASTIAVSIVFRNHLRDDQLVDRNQLSEGVDHSLVQYDGQSFDDNEI